MNGTPTKLAAVVLAAAVAGCGGADSGVLEGRPGGPYRMTLALAPAPVTAGRETILTTRVLHAADGTPVQDLQIVHERVVHNFIVNLDYSNFAHIHHEDFAPLTTTDLDAATLHFPYTFPRPGHYRMVSEFTHRDRSWTKHFDIAVGAAGTPQVTVDLRREKIIDGFSARLSVSPAVPLAGLETELVLELARDRQPVTDLQLLLGSEVHVALWRIDGEHFGHAHSYTPHMAAMLATMHDRASDPRERARAMSQMMVRMMKAPAELVFPGPRIPIRYVFPEPGIYAIFLQCAPGGEARVFSFMLEVENYRDGMDTRIKSMLETHAHQPADS